MVQVVRCLKPEEKSRWVRKSRVERRALLRLGAVYVKNDGMDQYKYDLTKLGSESLHYKVDMTMEREAHGMLAFNFSNTSFV